METGQSSDSRINNDFYDALGERWYRAQDDPVALLRAEAALRNPWIEEQIRAALGWEPARVLDMGCGAGFLTNYLALMRHDVTGVDLSVESLEVARRYDFAGTVNYEVADVLELPYADESFDVVCALDLLEHVEEPERAIAEASRVLAPDGLFFFHTFNRNFLAWLVVIKGLEWFVRNTPPNMHVLQLFLKPGEVAAMCERHDLDVITLIGSAPEIRSWAFLQMLLTRRVPEDLRFRFTPSTIISYAGIAKKAT